MPGLPIEEEERGRSNGEPAPEWKALNGYVHGAPAALLALAARSGRGGKETAAHVCIACTTVERQEAGSGRVHALVVDCAVTAYTGTPARRHHHSFNLSTPV